MNLSLGDFAAAVQIEHVECCLGFLLRQEGEEVVLLNIIPAPSIEV